jgi:hypothetical protein
MKNILVFSILFFVASATMLHAQITNTWKGGFPGHETDWGHSRNWSLNTVPNAFQRVIIPDVSTSTRRYPVVAAGAEVEVQSLEIRAGASLTLSRTARLLADEFTCQGTCIGCERRILIENDTPLVTTSNQQNTPHTGHH